MQWAMKCQLFGPWSFCSFVCDRQSAHLAFSRIHFVLSSCHFHLVIVEPLVIVSDFFWLPSSSGAFGLAGDCPAAAPASAGTGVVASGVWPNASVAQHSTAAASAILPTPIPILAIA